MADYCLSNQAADDLAGIYRFSHESFGEAKADAYLQSLEERFISLADNPALGRAIDTIRKGYFRFEHVSHSIFYTKKNAASILIVRVLHNGMDMKRHF